MRLRDLLALLLLTAPWRPVTAQTTARDSVVATVQRVFDAMRTRDTTGLRALFDSTARLTAVPDSATRPTRPSTVSQFLTGIAATPAEQAFDERMYEPEVRIDGPIAQVWTYYTFRRGTTFSHCGVDAVTLMRREGGWRIASFVWTIRRTGCTRAE
jgi:hypothetical protein